MKSYVVEPLTQSRGIQLMSLVSQGVHVRVLSLGNVLKQFLHVNVNPQLSVISNNSILKISLIHCFVMVAFSMSLHFGI